MPLNNNRTASFGSEGWPELRALLPDLVRQSRAMTVTPQMQDACIGDMLVTCESAKTRLRHARQNQRRRMRL